MNTTTAVRGLRAVALTGALTLAMPLMCNSLAAADAAMPAVTTWAAAPVDMTGPYGDETMRQILHPSVAGAAPQLRLSNTFGSTPVTFDSVWIGDQDSGAAIADGTNRRVTFGGRPAVTVAAGAEVLSDPVAMGVSPSKNLAVSIHVAGGTTGQHTTGHLLAMQNGWFSTGDTAADPAATTYTGTMTSRYWIDQLVVRPANQTTGTVVTLGDSITDGYQSTVDANHRYPDDLAVRLGGRFGVANAGIAGNATTLDRGAAGVRMPDRIERDVFSQPHVKAIVYLEGINDISYAALTTADPIIQADQQLVARAHAAGVKVIAGTLLPFQGSATYSDAGNTVRQQLNDWIRTSGTFDGVADYDAALRDPVNPLQLLPRYASADHLHPNDAGYQVMADTVPVQLF